MTTFENYPLKKEILKAIHLLNYKAPTKVQEEVIPKALEEKELVVKSQTGSGKTAAFAIPLCDKVEWEENKPQVLVLTPTRELAMQIKDDFFNIGRFRRLKVTALYGRAPFHVQQRELKQKTHIVVGTPGRVIDHLEKGTFDTSCIKYLVIDEADEMFRMGFIEQVETIAALLPKERMTMLFSATIDKHIEELCTKYMRSEPIKIEIASQNITADKIEELRYDVEAQKKVTVLKDLLTVENPESSIIFCNTKEQVEKVYDALREASYRIVKIHGSMEQKDRFAVMEDFRKGKFRYLVATDVAARGIDIDHVTHVINYDVPDNKENYVHRIGRTGRAGRKGKALTLVAANEVYYLKIVEGYIEHELLKMPLPSQEEVEKAKAAFEEKMATSLPQKEAKGEKLSEGIMRLHINAGKKTKMRAVDIVGTLCNLPGMTADDIGIINILDISTFVEVLNNKGEGVYKALQTTPIKGRLRRVSKAEINK